MVQIDRPIFMIGTGRSGTTVLFESLANHPDLGWFSHHFDRFPRLPIVSFAARLCDVSPFFRKAITPSSRRRPWLEPLRDSPAEAYRVWETYCGEKFRHDYLLGQRASEAERRATREMVAKVLAYHGKPRFATKVTGPARMGFLLSIFPDARFVNVIRDGRAVVHSLLRVKQTQGFENWSKTLDEPSWRGGLREDYLHAWEERGRSPLALAAVQWRNLIERAREEREEHKPEGYLEVRYEDFLEDPHGVIDAVCRACELPPSERIRDFIDNRLRLGNVADRYRETFSAEELAMLDELMGDLLVELGYRV